MKARFVPYKNDAKLIHSWSSGIYRMETTIGPPNTPTFKRLNYVCIQYGHNINHVDQRNLSNYSWIHLNISFVH